MIGQKAQRPTAVAVGRRAASQGDHLCLRRSVNLRSAARARFVMERSF